jgi:hypothetical protein
MVDLGGEADFRRLEWIVRREGNGEEKDATGVGGITLLRRRVGKPKLESSGAKRLTGPMIVACHWNILSPVGPAEQEDGGSRPRSINSWTENR